MKNIFQKLLRSLLVFIPLFMLSFILLQKVTFACSCGSGSYSCNGGNMCCTGGGCPSYACANQGSCREWIWHPTTCPTQTIHVARTCYTTHTVYCPTQCCYTYTRVCHGCYGSYCWSYDCGSSTSCYTCGNYACGSYQTSYDCGYNYSYTPTGCGYSACGAYYSTQTCNGSCSSCSSPPPPTGDGTSPSTPVTYPPVCSSVSGPDSLVAGKTGTYTANATDQDGTVTSYQWSNSPSGGVFGTKSGNTIPWTAPNVAATYEVGGIVTDNTGLTSFCPAKSTIILPTYDLRVTVWQKYQTDTTCNTGSTKISGANVTVYDGSIATNPPLLGSGTTSSTGTTLITNNSILVSQKTLKICVFYSTTCSTFYMSCPVGASGGCSNVTVTPSAATTIDVAVAIERNKVNSWFTALDGDIYGQGVGTVAACSGHAVNGSFNGNLINLTNGFADNGYVFSTGGISTTDVSSSTTTDGYAKLLTNQQSSIDKLAYTAPTTAQTATILNLTAGNIYKMTAATFNTLTVNPITYSVSGTGVAILYVDAAATATINIKNSITTLGTNRILLITNSDIAIAYTVGIPEASYSLTGTPQIMLGMLAKGKIVFNTHTPTDNPIMVEGPLISDATGATAEGIIFRRDLGEDNDLYPAVTVKYNPIYLTSLNTLLPTTVTGINHFDIQWDYGY